MAADAFELDRLLEAVAGNIGLHFGDHRLDTLGDRVAIGVVAKAINGVAHDQRRFGGVEYDARLAAGRAAARHDRFARRLGELVDVGACARASTIRRHRGDAPTIISSETRRVGKEWY